MSTFRKRKGKWFVEIRKKYFKPIRKTFEYKLDAEKYAREKQAEIDKGFLVSYEQAQSTKLGELLERYRTEITSKKKKVANGVVARDEIKPPTQTFSELCQIWLDHKY